MDNNNQRSDNEREIIACIPLPFRLSDGPLPKTSDYYSGDPFAKDEDQIQKQKGGISMKDKLLSFLGGFGMVLWYLLSLVVSVLPFVMIGTRFWITLILIGVEMAFPATSIIFWIWGLVCALQGAQDVWAIIYYIASVVLFLPYFISIISGFFNKR